MNDTTEENSQPKFSRTALWAGGGGGLLILGAIALSTNHPLGFFSLEGLMIVVGGVMAVAFMSYGRDEVKEALAAIGAMFHEQKTTHATMHHDVKDILNWARIVKEKGMRGLEDTMGYSDTDDDFVRFGLTMVISDYTPDEVRSMMETAADAYYERDSVPVQVLQSMASHAPAFGMVGTLIGMVTMLFNLNANPGAIGPALAVSFLATLYGVVTARMLYIPAAARLTQKIDNMRFRNYLLTEGMAMLAANKSPIFIQDRLNSFLRPEMHGNMTNLLHDRAVAQLKAFRA